LIDLCLAVPLRILNIKENEAVAEFNGIKRNIRTDLIKNLNIGDYVLVHAGFAIEKLKEQIAIETLKAIQEVDDVMNEDNYEK
jgi:hydrogenase expression/formation protein HypC